MGLLSSVAKAAQRIVVGDEATRKRKQRAEVPAMRMIITEEPRPSHHDQVRSWINGSNELPDRAERINRRIHELHTTNYMDFPQGEGTLGVHRSRAFNSNPHDVGKFYDEHLMGSRKKTKVR